MLFHSFHSKITNFLFSGQFQVRNLKYLAPFSTLANIITVTSFGIIFYFIFRDPISVEGKEPFGEVKKIPFFIGTVLFSLESVGVVSVAGISIAFLILEFLNIRKRKSTIYIYMFQCCRLCRWKTK